MFKIYSSSAGSGKTFTLTKEYLKLALQSEDSGYFRHILAVTFTNAAAHEMKERIMSSLRSFSSTEEGEHPMFRQVVAELYPQTQNDPAALEEAATQIRLRARNTLERILHQYADFSVMTIDKFTNRLVSSFTDELELPFGFETVLERDLMDAAIDRLLARIGLEGEEVLTEIVEKFYLEKAQEGKSWKSLPSELKKASTELLNESGHVFLTKVSHLDMSDWMTIRGQLLTFIREKEKLVISTAENAMSLIQEEELQESDFYQGRNGISKYFDNRKSGLKLFEEPNSHIGKTINEGKWYGGKMNVTAMASIDRIAERLEQYVLSIERVRLDFSDRIILYRNLEKHIHKLSLLTEIGKEFETLLRQNNQAHISEFNRKIMEIVAREPVPFLYERLGERYNHILIDEFQDTSKLQFSNLLPLIDNALAGGHFNLIVGDAKQSIYRFRGGDMDLLLHLSNNQMEELSEVLGKAPYTDERLQSLMYFLEVEQLRTNRRSCREITMFNNSFFDSIAQSLAEENPGIKAIYNHNFKQEIVEHTPSGGHVAIEFIELNPVLNADDVEEDDADTSDHDAMAHRVIELITGLREKGYEWRDIAILCRKNAEAARLANVLKQRNWPLISEDSLLLNYADTVRLIIALMKVFNNPENTTERFESALLFHRVVLRNLPGSDELFNIQKMCTDLSIEAYLQYFAAYEYYFVEEDLRNSGIYEFCENICGKFGLFGNGEDEYIFRFLDVVLSYANKKTNRADDFLAYWEQRKGNLSITISRSSDAIRITSIHKSKGLEFPVVIIPYANWSFVPRFDQPVWMDLPDDATLEIQDLNGRRRLVSSQLNMVSELEMTPLSPKYQEEKTRVLIENLNLLYVALTRPVERLYLLAKAENNWNKSGKSINFWLYDYLNRPDAFPAWAEGTLRYTISEGRNIAGPVKRTTGPVPYPMGHLISVNKMESLKLRRMADRIFDLESFDERFDPIQKTKYALSFLQSSDDIPAVIKRLTSEGIASSAEIQQLDALLREVISIPELSDCFAPEASILLHRELLLPGGKILTPDRIVIAENGSCTVLNISIRSDVKKAKEETESALHALQSMHFTSITGMVVSLEDKNVVTITL